MTVFFGVDETSDEVIADILVAVINGGEMQ